jgi:hypothetical protein
MRCREFQKMLPEIIDHLEASDAKGHLKSCKKCSQLVADLKFISERARLLLPLMEPSPKVWLAIEKSLPRVSSKKQA